MHLTKPTEPTELKELLADLAVVAHLELDRRLAASFC
jgi:hypothetical protein